MARDIHFGIFGRDRSDPAWRSARQKAQSFKSFLGRTFKGGLFAGLLGGAGGLAGLASFNRALSEFDQIGKRARTAGLSAEFYQTLGEAAEDASVDQGKFNQSLIAAVKRMGELKAGYGEASTNLEKLDASLAKSLRNSKTQEEAFRLAADAIARTNDAQKKATITSVLYSRAGVEMGRVLEEGSAGLDRTAERAERLGLIIDRDLIAGAEKLQTEYGRAHRILKTQFMRTLITLTPIVEAFAGWMERAGEAWRGVDGIFSGSTFTLAKLTAKLAEVNAAIRTQSVLAEQAKTSGQFSARDVILAKEKLQRLKDEQAELRKVIALRLREREVASAPVIDGRDINVTGERAPRPRNKPKAIVEEFQRQQRAADKAAKEAERRRKKAADLAKREQEQIDNVINSLRFEAEQMRRTAEQQDIHNQLREAGVTLASKEGRTIEGLVKGIHKYRKEQELIRRVTLEVQDASFQAWDAITARIGAGERGLKKFLIQLGLVIARTALLGGGPSGGTGLLGALVKGFSGFFATGGGLRAGQWGIAGENGPEPVFGPSTVGSFSDFKKLVAGSNGGGGGGGFTQVNHWQISGGGREMMPLVRQAIEDSERRMTQTFGRRMDNARARGAAFSQTGRR